MIYYLSHEMNTGFLSDDHRRELGAFSWWESLKMGGTGSPKAHYLTGLHGFDQLLKEKKELLLINFELTRRALLFRAWLRNDCYVAFCFYPDITGWLVDDIVRDDKTWQARITFADHDDFICLIPKDYRHTFENFFNKVMRQKALRAGWQPEGR